MWAKPNQLTTAGTARPLRVAYLIDTDDCPDQLLDRIFAEAYGRWGGRRTLIIPAKLDGIDDRYTEWLWYYDPDVIYSFVALTDETAAVGIGPTGRKTTQPGLLLAASAPSGTR